MKTLTDDSVRVFGAGILMRHLYALEDEIKGVRRGGDIENIHRMRVASRRFRSAFPLFSDCFPGKKTRRWNQEIRKITRSLGSARDADVQIEHLQTILARLPEKIYRPGVRRLLTRIKQERVEQQAYVLRSLNAFEKSGAITDISKSLAPWAAIAVHPFPFSRTLYLLAYRSIQAAKKELLSYERYIHSPEKVAELHAMRVAAKILRYTLEIFAPLYPARFKMITVVVKDMQELLGSIHDADVWIDFLPRFIDEERIRTVEYYNSARPMKRLIPGIIYLQELHLDERKRHYNEFIQFWDHSTGVEPIWDKLDELITRPLSFEDELFPPAGKGDQAKWTP
jgi:CHAD domain-containing protein